jgi:hypothetical protein
MNKMKVANSLNQYSDLTFSLRRHLINLIKFEGKEITNLQKIINLTIDNFHIGKYHLTYQSIEHYCDVSYKYAQKLMNQLVREMRLYDRYGTKNEARFVPHFYTSYYLKQQENPPLKNGEVIFLEDVIRKHDGQWAELQAHDIHFKIPSNCDLFDQLTKTGIKLGDGNRELAAINEGNKGIIGEIPPFKFTIYKTCIEAQVGTTDKPIPFYESNFTRLFNQLRDGLTALRECNIGKRDIQICAPPISQWQINQVHINRDTKCESRLLPNEEITHTVNNIHYRIYTHSNTNRCRLEYWLYPKPPLNVNSFVTHCVEYDPYRLLIKA